MSEELRDDVEFSVFRDFNHYAKRVSDELKAQKGYLQWGKRINKRLRKLFKKNKVLYVNEISFDCAGHDDVTGWLDIECTLPRLLNDYWFCVIDFLQERTVDSFKHIFKRDIVIWALTVESDNESKYDVDFFDVSTPNKQDGYVKSDVVKYTKLWLDKYYKEYDIIVEYKDI